MITVQTNGPYPNRIQLLLGDWVGPLVRPTSPPEAFDPSVDLEVYVDGLPVPVSAWFFDRINNRYLLFTDRPINLRGVI